MVDTRVSDEELQLSLTQQSYQELKEHFLTRFSQIDRDLVAIQSLDANTKKVELQKKVHSFVQEGIGAFIAYLPSQVAISTLRDFLNILSPNLKVVDQAAPIAAPATLVNIPAPSAP